jgi:hypothetical protein
MLLKLFMNTKYFTYGKILTIGIGFEFRRKLGLHGCIYQ